MNTIFQWASFAGQEAALFVISMIPLIELRGAVILGAALQMPWHEVFVITVIGNILPVPFVVLFVKRIIHLLKKVPLFSGFIHWYEARLIKHSQRFTKLSFWALVIFVGIPLPGTGAWTGSLIAALLNIRLKNALPVILAGVVIAGLIVTGITYGFISLVT